MPGTEFIYKINKCLSGIQIKEAHDKHDLNL